MAINALSTSSGSKLIHREREREKRRLIRHLKRSLSYHLVPEPFLTPFHHINLIFAELKVPFLGLPEAQQAVQEVVTRYGSLMHSKVWANSGETSSSATSKKVRKRRKNLQSILQASQTSMSQYEEHSQSLQRSALLLDAVEVVCSQRDLVIDRHTVKKIDDFASIPVIPHKSVLLYVDKENPFFLSVFAFSASKLQQVHPFVLSKGPTLPSEVTHTQFQVICSSPYPVQWRTVVPQCLRLVNPECVVATIYKVDSSDVGSINDPNNMEKGMPIGGGSYPSQHVEDHAYRSSIRRFPMNAVKNQPLDISCPARKRGYGELDASAWNEEEMWYLFRSPVPSEPSTDSDADQGSGNYSGRSFASSSTEKVLPCGLYRCCPFPLRSLFLPENIVADPFLDLPKGYLRNKPRRDWHASAFRKCKGNNVRKRLLMEQAHKMTMEEDEEDRNDFL